MTRALLLLVAACGRVGFDAAALARDASPADGTPNDAAGLQPTHRYPLNGNFADDFGGPALMPLAGGGTLGASGYAFLKGNGLALANAVPASVYTIDIELSFDDLPAGAWRKIVDFKNLVTDEGLYTFGNAFQFVIVSGSGFATSPAILAPAVQFEATLTRDASGMVVGYVDRVSQISFADTNSVATFMAPTNVANFVIDDTATGGSEATSGVVREIRIWDVALTPAQIAQL
jgi:hypothetical protein